MPDVKQLLTFALAVIAMTMRSLFVSVATTLSSSAISNSQNSRVGHLDVAVDDPTVAVIRTPPPRNFNVSENSNRLPVIHNSNISKNDDELLNEYSYDNNVVVFYHIFIPSNQGDEGVRRALHIVQEQLDQVRNSYAAATKSALVVPLQVYYTTVGMRGALNESFMQSVCTGQTSHHRHRHPLDCIYLQHHDEGHEEIMLQRVHNYCRQRPKTTRRITSNSTSTNNNNDNDKIRVIYLHTKGSFHDHAGQQHWRRYMTAAATSRYCVSPPHHKNGDDDDAAFCNACGLLYSPIFVSYFPGNIWTADCQYISKLLPLQEFAQKKQELALDAMNIVKNSSNSSRHHRRAFSIHAFQAVNMEKPYFWGAGRYAAEHWIGSHPDIVPCDVSRRTNLAFWWEADRKTNDDLSSSSLSDFEFDMAPRRNLVGLRWPVLDQKIRMKQVVASDQLRLSDISLLAGAIHRWIGLYNAIPPDNSWVWSWFPDGPEWRNSVKQHWHEALNVMLGNYSIVIGQQWQRDITRHGTIFLKQWEAGESWQ